MTSNQSGRWALKPLDELAYVGAGNPAPQDKKLFEGGRYPFIRTSDVGQIRFGEIDNAADLVNEQGAAKLRLVPKGAVLMPKSGASTFLNHRVVTTMDAFVSSHLATITPKDGITESRYLLYALSQVAAQDLLPENSYPSLNLNLIKTIEIPLPPLEEQRQIVAVLDEAFEGLSRARAHAEANLQNARELFESLLFEMLSERTEGWETHRLGDCFRLKSGENLTAKKMVPGPFPVYGGNGIAGTHHEFNLSGDNVIVGRVGALCGNARYIDHDIWLTDNAFKVVNYSFPFDHKFLTYLLNFKNLRSLARQAAQPVISNSSLSDLELTFPASVELQAELASKLAGTETELEDIQKKYESKIQDLDDLRQTLLQKAFAGELTRTEAA